MFDLSIQQVLFRIVAFLLVTALHGFALAAIARLLGDRGVVHDGRLTLNPLTHLDLLGLVGAIITRVGWIKPMAIDPEQLRFGRMGLVVCLLGALGTTLVIGLALPGVQGLVLTLAPSSVAIAIEIWLNIFREMSIWFALVNLLPLPPFGGGLLLAAIAPAAAARLQQHLIWLQLGVIALAIAGDVAYIRPAIAEITSILLP